MGPGYDQQPLAIPRHPGWWLSVACGLLVIALGFASTTAYAPRPLRSGAGAARQVPALLGGPVSGGLIHPAAVVGPCDVAVPPMS
jgi:hypothetical protein